MAFNPTDEQKKAIFGNGSMLVSAAAGSGKTAVLVERVINKLAPESGEPTPANRLLIVTFTEAAAKEMRGRIEKRLYSEIKKHPERKVLEKQRRLIQSADICTIDSFCIKTVRENFSSLGISPDFAVGNGSELAAKRGKLIESVLKPYFENGDKVFYTLLELMGCEYDEQNLCAQIETVFENAMLTPFPEQYLESIVKPYKIPFNSEHIWYKSTLRNAENSLKDALDDAARAVSVADYVARNTEKHKAYAEDMLCAISELNETAKTGDYEKLRDAFLPFTLPRLPSADKEDPCASEFKALKANIASSVKDLAADFEATVGEIENDRARFLPAVELFCDLCRQYAEGYYRLCAEENIFTFSFCEQLLRKLICDFKSGKPEITEYAKAIIGKYDEVMVDEYQDVNDLQDMLFTLLSDNGKHLFTVGDVKQSIYGFRGSNPENFMRKSELSKRENSGIHRVNLSDNFRSRSGVCSSVNHLFSNLLAGQTGSIVYGVEERLNPAAKFPENNALKSEIIVLDNADSENKRLDSEAVAIADYITEVMNEGKILREADDSLREAKYGDFAILLRSVKGKASHIADALTLRGIPVCYNAESFSETYEVNLVLSLLKIIDNPKSDLQLLTVMMSPLFDFSADEMAVIRAGSRKESLYSSVLKAAESGNGKAAKFVDFLAEYRRIFAVLPIGNGINELYAATDILNLVSVMPGGGEKRANLLTLMRLAEGYSEKSSGSVFGFLKYLSLLPDTEFKAGKTMRDGVKIMSMHTSKGLQFPICILANLTNKINNRDSVSNVLCSEEYGMAFRYYDEQALEKRKTVNHRLNAVRIAEKTVDEELRLLYVAATRAEERVCFVCSLDNAAARIAELSGKISETEPYISARALKKSVSMSDWVLMSALMNKGARELKKFYGVSCFEKESDHTVNIRILRASDESENKAFEAENNIAVNEELKEKMLENFAFVYPYERLRGIEAKVSVSSAANGEEAEKFAFTAKPAFMLRDGLSAAGRGTAMHHVMQYISFEDNVNVTDEIERLKEWKFINNAEAAAVDVKSIEDFFKSRIFSRIKSSNDVRREMRFLSEVPVSQLKEDVSDLPENTTVLVQGAVDLCFTEEDGVVVLDFKTDRVDNLEVLKERYSEQLEIYSKACEKTLGKPVKERIIYSFALSDYITF